MFVVRDRKTIENGEVIIASATVGRKNLLAHSKDCFFLSHHREVSVFLVMLQPSVAYRGLLLFFIKRFHLTFFVPHNLMFEGCFMLFKHLPLSSTGELFLLRNHLINILIIVIFFVVVLIIFFYCLLLLTLCVIVFCNISALIPRIPECKVFIKTEALYQALHDFSSDQFDSFLSLRATGFNRSTLNF